MDTKLHALFFEPPLSDNYFGHQIIEIYKDRAYEPLFNGKKLPVVLDIGASGITPYYFSQNADKVYAVEPSAPHHEALLKMIEQNEMTNTVAIKKAIFTENKTLPLFQNKNKTMKSLHMAIDDKSGEPEMVEAVTLEKLFEENNITHVDLMKIDMEGTEFEVLGHSSFSRVADKIDMIAGETHTWANRNPNQMKDMLEARGFKFEWLGTEATIFVAHK